MKEKKSSATPAIARVDDAPDAGQNEQSNPSEFMPTRRVRKAERKPARKPSRGAQRGGY